MNAHHGIRYETFGYFLEYMVNGKYMGSINIEKPDREKIGYCGRKYNVAINDIVFSNKKKIKKGTEYYTHLYPLCGRSNYKVESNTLEKK
tara:strand:- start:332 stop:601 length:270 start_codon:yes stop_codon:yes gene_type:complete